MPNPELDNLTLIKAVQTAEKEGFEVISASTSPRLLLQVQKPVTPESTQPVNNLIRESFRASLIAQGWRFVAFQRTKTHYVITLEKEPSP